MKHLDSTHMRNLLLLSEGKEAPSETQGQIVGAWESLKQATKKSAKPKVSFRACLVFPTPPLSAPVFPKDAREGVGRIISY